METAMMKMWEDRGITFVAETLSKKAKGAKTGADKVQMSGLYDIAVIIDLEKFRKAFGDDYILQMADGTSLRVKIQGWHRDAYPEARLTDEQLSSRLEQLFTGAKFGGARTKTVTVTVRVLPNGAKYDGDSEAEFRAAFTAALVDLGVPAELAIERAKAVVW